MNSLSLSDHLSQAAQFAFERTDLATVPGHFRIDEGDVRRAAAFRKLPLDRRLHLLAEIAHSRSYNRYYFSRRNGRIWAVG
jgi:hypothetical protein